MLLYYARYYEAYPGASLFCEIKFKSVFLSIFFANYDRYSRVSPEPVSEARTESETEPEPGDQPEPETREWREGEWPHW